MRGYLDNLTSSGYLEGWAFDPANPLKALRVAVLADGFEIARGVAHRFRKDLMESGCGTGWCAFRLMVEGSVEHLPRITLKLVERDSGGELHVNRSISCVVDAERAVDTLEVLCACDPTTLDGVWQLRGCERLIMAYIRKNGVEQFVRLAYTYVLGRPADDGGALQYGKLLRQGRLTPVGVLEALADNDEYRSQPRRLVAPNALGFPFA
jgi:hypothetical protein